MLYLAFVFMILAGVAAVFGFWGIVGAAVGIAKLLFWVFVALFIISFLIGLGTLGRPRAVGPPY